MTLQLETVPIAMRGAIERELQKVKDLEFENKLLREELRLLRLEKYGKGSEKLTDAQLELLEGEPGVKPAEVQAEAALGGEQKQAVEAQSKPRRNHPGREELPAHLPRVEVMISCAPEACRCGQCGGEKKIIGYEVSEELDLKPAEYFVNVIKREKRACGACEELGVSTAPAPAKIIEKGKASDRLAVDILVKKYSDHQPLYRQSAAIERESGVELSRMTLCGWVMKTGGLLEAIRRAMREELLEGSYIQADETPVGVQSERTIGKNHQGYLWEYSRPGGNVIFDFQMGRSREGPRQFLGQFDGIVQCDGYGAYDKIGGAGIVMAGCWAHARRGFYQALEVSGNTDAVAFNLVRRIGELYAIEAEARAGKLDPAARQEMRRARSLPLLAALKTALVEARAGCLPQSQLGKACDYALSQWPRLVVYASHGEVEIDNNWCENAIRPVALGRKNWLHIGSEAAGPKVAAITSVLETCKRLGINARDYLLDVLPRLAGWPASKVRALTPAAWLSAHRQATSQV
ncbi:MAG TPA: IS66 family transposase [Chthoniobacterales bacterium]